MNKVDLGTRLDCRRISRRIGDLGLPCVEMSARSAAGLTELRDGARGRVTMLVGQSGVGKSSLVNALAPEAAAQTAELTRDAEGRHTTTTARWYTLERGAAIIDAPGVRDFAPPASLVRAAESGFVEIHATQRRLPLQRLPSSGRAGLRRAHRRAAGEIAARRYESYRRFPLYEKLRLKLAPP